MPMIMQRERQLVDVQQIFDTALSQRGAVGHPFASELDGFCGITVLAKDLFDSAACPFSGFHIAANKMVRTDGEMRFEVAHGVCRTF